ncbi:MAG: hypothetical protein FWF53_08405 [Candidatus Azobacteroides sp.]|nr:hypothetical protein [Candidatus Azobacteroides sp.]
MKRKYVISIIVASFLFTGIKIQAQGMFGDEKTDQKTTTTATPPSGFFRAGEGEDESGDDWGGGGEERPQDPPGESPIGEGVLFLSLLTGGYALVKRNVRKKDEE